MNEDNPDSFPVFLIRVRYKSGAVQDFECVEFFVERTASGNQGARWRTYGEVVPMLFNLDEVESIWQIGVRQVKKS